MNEYVHGYSEIEANRLNDQADSLANLLHYDTLWEKGSLILEAGCGVGAQTKTVAPQNPDSQFISIDISQESVNQAKKVIKFISITVFVQKIENIFNNK